MNRRVQFNFIFEKNISMSHTEEQPVVVPTEEEADELKLRSIETMVKWGEAQSGIEWDEAKGRIKHEKNNRPREYLIGKYKDKRGAPEWEWVERLRECGLKFGDDVIIYYEDIMPFPAKIIDYDTRNDCIGCVICSCEPRYKPHDMTWWYLMESAPTHQIKMLKTTRVTRWVEIEVFQECEEVDFSSLKKIKKIKKEEDESIK